jgi:hypothetical protein
MYRCYLLLNGRIGMRDGSDVEQLDMAILRCRTLLIEQPLDGNFSGFEIWLGTSLVHSEPGTSDNAT